MYFIVIPLIVPPISVLVTPDNPEVMVGDTVVFTCSIDLAIPVDHFIWTLNGVNLPANADVRKCVVKISVVGLLKCVCSMKKKLLLYPSSYS